MKILRIWWKRVEGRWEGEREGGLVQRYGWVCVRQEIRNVSFDVIGTFGSKIIISYKWLLVIVLVVSTIKGI